MLVRQSETTRGTSVDDVGLAARQQSFVISRKRRNVTMTLEVRNVAEQNSALLTSLAGIWTANLTANVHSALGVSARISTRTRLGDGKVRCLFQPLPTGGVAGHYMPIQH